MLSSGNEGLSILHTQDPNCPMKTNGSNFAMVANAKQYAADAIGDPELFKKTDNASFQNIIEYHQGHNRLASKII